MIPLRFAINATLFILTIVIIFHLTVLAGIVPYTIVWGGRFQNESDLRTFEIASLIFNAFMIFVILVKAQYVNFRLPVKVLNAILWLFILLFGLNTIGNLLARTATETIIFTPITFILALLCFRIVKG